MSFRDWFFPVEPESPKPVGYFLFGGLKLMQFKKPSEQHIKNHEELLGWKWVDIKEEDK